VAQKSGQPTFSRTEDIFDALQSGGVAPKPVEQFPASVTASLYGDPGVVLFRRRTAAALSFLERFSALTWTRGYDTKTDFGQMWQDTLSTGSEQEMRLTLTRINTAVKGQTKRLLDWLTARVNTKGDGAPVVVFNPQSWTRTDTVECPSPFPGQRVNVVLTDSLGAKALGQNLGSSLRFTARNVPPFGWKVYWAKRTAMSKWRGVRVTSTMLENEFLRVTVDPNGGAITSVYDNRRKVELLKQGGGFGKPELLNSLADQTPLPLKDKSEVVMMEHGPARARVTFDRLYSDCQFTGEVMLYDGLPRLDLRLTIDWDATRPSEQIASISLPVAGKADRVERGVAFGSESLAPGNAMFPVLRWLRLPDSYTPLLTDSATVFQLRDSKLRSLILGPKDAIATGLNQYTIDVTYSLLADSSHAPPSTIVRRAIELGEPMVARLTDRHHGAMTSSTSLLSVSPSSVIVCGLKRSEGGSDLTLRLYDVDGTASVVCIMPSCKTMGYVETDLLERKTGSPITTDSVEQEIKVGKHEIKTIKLKLER